MVKPETIESVVLGECGRGIDKLAEYAAGGLGAAASRLVTAPGVAIVTGFAVPAAGGPTPETDGPIGAASLAAFLNGIGVQVTVLTDEVNAAVLAAALSAYDVEWALRVVAANGLDAADRELSAAGVNTVVFIERLGPNAAGRYLSMSGKDLTASTVALDPLAGKYFSIGIGDGGNEIGMGKVPAAAIAAVIARGDDIHCIVPTDLLVLAGVSNWGGWGLVAGAAAANPLGRDAAALALSTPRWHESLRRAVEAGAVDGIRMEAVLSVDGFDQHIHDGVLQRLRSLASVE